MNDAETKAGNIYMEKTKKTNTNSQQYQYLTQSEKKSDPKYGLYISIIMILFLSIILFCLFAYTMLRIDTDANILGHWVTVLIFLVTISATISPLIVYDRQSKFEREIKNTIIKKHKIIKKYVNDISQSTNSKLQEYNNLNMEKFQEIEKFNLAVRQELLNFHIGTTRQALFVINTSKDNRFFGDYFLNMIECLKFVIGQYPLDTRKKILNALCKAFCLDMDFLKKTHPQYIDFLSDIHITEDIKNVFIALFVYKNLDEIKNFIDNYKIISDKVREEILKPYDMQLKTVVQNMVNNSKKSKSSDTKNNEAQK